MVNNDICSCCPYLIQFACGEEHCKDCEVEHSHFACGPVGPKILTAKRISDVCLLEKQWEKCRYRIKAEKQSQKQPKTVDLEGELAEQMETANWIMRLGELIKESENHGIEYSAGYKQGLGDGSDMAELVLIEAFSNEEGKDLQFDDKVKKILSAPKRIIKGG